MSSEGPRKHALGSYTSSLPLSVLCGAQCILHGPAFQKTVHVGRLVLLLWCRVLRHSTSNRAARTIRTFAVNPLKSSLSAASSTLPAVRSPCSILLACTMLVQAIDVSSCAFMSASGHCCAALCTNVHATSPCARSARGHSHSIQICTSVVLMAADFSAHAPNIGPAVFLAVKNQQGLLTLMPLAISSAVATITARGEAVMPGLEMALWNQPRS